MKLNLQSIAINVLLIVVIIGIIVLILSLVMGEMREANTWIQCCDGYVCSDTYYTPEDNMCHLVLCEQQRRLFLGNMSDCLYEGKNQSINLTSSIK